MEPLADPGAHDDHGPAARVDRVGGELASDPDGGLGRNAGDRRLPRRGERSGRVVVAGRPVARQAVAGHAVVREHQVEDGGDQAVADPRHRDAAAHHVAGAVGCLEVRQQHLGGLRLDLRIAQRQRRHDTLQVEIPLAHAGVGVAEADRAVRHHRPAAGRVEQHRLPGGLGIAAWVVPRGPAQVSFGEELARNQPAVLGVLDQGDQERQVGVGAHVLDEERHPPVDEELLQDHVPHGHRQRRVGAGLGGQPLVGELGVVGVVGADRDHLGAAVAHLGHPVRVRRPGDRHVRAPHHQIGGVPPVTGLRHVGLVAEDLRAGYRQVGVPVVEGGHHPAEQLGEAGADAVGDHRHRRNRREAGHPVRSVRLDRVHVRRGDHLHRLGPAGPDQAALAARRLVDPASLRVPGHVGPGEDWVAEPLLGLPVHLQQHASDVRVADPGGGVGVPGEGSTAGAAARLVLGTVRTDRGVVGLLGLPGDDAVADVHLPRAGAGAVHPVGGPHHLVMAPSVPVEHVSGPAAFEEGRPAVVGLLPAGEEPAHRQQRVGRPSVSSCTRRAAPYLRMLRIQGGRKPPRAVQDLRLLEVRTSGLSPETDRRRSNEKLLS